MSRLIVGAALLVMVVTTGGKQSGRATQARALRPDDLTHRDVLANAADDEDKREFILDCTGCHQMDMARTFAAGQRRSDTDWQAIVERMLSYAGARTGFPVIGSRRDPMATAAWMARAIGEPATITRHQLLGSADIGHAQVREFLLDVPGDLPHDVAIDIAGRVVVTGMMSHQLLLLDTASGRWTGVPIPVPQANPRAVEVDAAGRWWVALGRPQRVARYTPDGPSKGWAVFDAGMYAHSVAIGPSGGVWINGHFTRAPELIAQVDTARGTVNAVALPGHPQLADDPGGPIPYEIRVAPDGRVWTSELRGNRLVGVDPRTGAAQVITLPRAHMGPRRFDIDRRGVLWVPAYAANTLLRIDPTASGPAQLQEFPLPVSNVLPYVVRMAPGDSSLWLGTGAGGGVFRFDIAAARYTYVPLPSAGALIRHLTVDPRTGDLWLAYGASPGIPARIARLRMAAEGAPAAASLPAAPRPIGQGDPRASFRTDTLASGVYAISPTAPLGFGMDPNSLVVVGREGVLVVDAQFSASSTAAVIDAVHAITPTPVRWLVNTHWHDDHVAGNREWKRRYPQIAILSHRLTRHDMQTEGAANRAAFMKDIPGTAGYLRTLIADKRGIDGRPTDETELVAFESYATLIERFKAESASVAQVFPTQVLDNTLRLRIGGRRVELRFLGRAHTRSDIVVSLPDDGILASGDLVVWPVPFVGTTSFPREMGTTLERMLALPHRLIVPGHGPVLHDDAYVRDVARMLATIRSEVDEMRRRGDSLAVVRRSVTLDEHRTHFAGDDRLKNELFVNYVLESAIPKAFRDGALADAPRRRRGGAAGGS